MAIHPVAARIVTIDGVAHDPNEYTKEHPAWKALLARATELAEALHPASGAPASVVDCIVGAHAIACENASLWGDDAERLDRWVTSLTRGVLTGRLPVSALAPAR